MGQIWLERLLRWNAKIQKLLIGRYARIDQLNKLLLRTSIILLIIHLFLPITVISFLAIGLLIWANYRFFSKRIYPRANENTRYLARRQKVVSYFTQTKEKIKQRKHYAYFKCPSCQQQLRAPKGKGKIKVTCSTCKHQFNKTV